MNPSRAAIETLRTMAPSDKPLMADACPGRIRKWLVAAGIYNLVWGAWVVLFPLTFFEWLGLDRPVYPQIWQCVGMIVGVYGVGYLVAARDPARHWPIVLVGLLGKIFGPLGFVAAAVRGELPWAFGATILTNDLIWYPSFFAALALAWRQSMTSNNADTLSPRDAMARTQTSAGESVLAESERSKLLVVFLRHAGCTFCREAIADLGVKKDEITRDGTRIALVFMSGKETVQSLADKQGIGDALLIEDPERSLYRAFELGRGNLWQLFGPGVILRGIGATLRGHFVGKMQGDGLQMPGAFLVKDGAILRAFRHENAASRPDYCELAAT